MIGAKFLVAKLYKDTEKKKRKKAHERIIVKPMRCSVRSENLKLLSAIPYIIVGKNHFSQLTRARFSYESN